MCRAIAPLAVAAVAFVWGTVIVKPMVRPAAAAEIVVTFNREQAVAVRSGDIVIALPPMKNVRWHVSFDRAALEPLVPAERLQEPDEHGWRFRVTATDGETTLTVTPITRGANPPHFTATIRIEHDA